MLAQSLAEARASMNSLSVSWSWEVSQSMAYLLEDLGTKSFNFRGLEAASRGSWSSIMVWNVMPWLESQVFTESRSSGGILISALRPTAGSFQKSRLEVSIRSLRTSVLELSRAPVRRTL